MIQAILTVILVVLLFILGHFTQAIKKLLGFITKWILKFLSFFGLKISTKEKSVEVSEEFKNTYKDIKIVKLSKKNIKQKHSIDIIGLSVLFIALILFIVNAVTGYAISNWIHSWMSKIPLLNSILTRESMNTYYTAVLFSIMSFSISRIINRWKETKQQRKENREALLKLRATKLMSSKELIEKAQEKDEQKYKELK